MMFHCWKYHWNPKWWVEKGDSGLKNMAIVGYVGYPDFGDDVSNHPNPPPPSTKEILGSHSRRFRVSFRQPGFWMSGSWYPFMGPFGGPNDHISKYANGIHGASGKCAYIQCIHVYMYIMFFCMWLFIIILYTMLYNVMYDTNITYHASRDSCPLSMLQHLLSVLLSIESRNWNGLNGWPPFKPTWLQLLDFVTTFSTKNTFAVRHQVTSSLSTRKSIWSAGQGLLAV